MANRTVYSREEFLKEADIGDADLDRLERENILSPAGRADKATPYYDARSLSEVRAIRALMDLGYDLKKIARIRRKVGLPAGDPASRDGAGTPLLSVGELAERAGTSPRTIKHWEEKGIIEPYSRSPGGFRLYPESYVFFCLLIRDLQVFGYSLDEIQEVSDLFRDFHAISLDRGHFPAELATDKLARMQERIAALSDKMDQMGKGIGRWRGLLKQKRKEIESFEREIRKTASAQAGTIPAGARPATAKTKT